MKSEGFSRFYQRLLLLFSILIGFGLRVFRLDYQELRGDETFGYLFSLPSFRQIVNRTLELQEPHPVASYFVQSFWLDWAGNSEFSLRFPSLWFSVLAIALLVGLGCSLQLSRAAVAISTLLMAVSPYAIWHSQDARMYGMSLALTLASSWFFMIWLTKSRADSISASKERPIIGRFRPVAWVYVSVTWLALHTHYFAAFIVIAQNLFVLLLLLTSNLRWTLLVRWIRVQILLSLAYLPWLISAQGILTDYGGNGDSPGLLEMLGRSLRAFIFGQSISEQWVWVAAVLTLMSLILLLLRKNRTITGFLLLYWLVPLFATWFSALRRPIFDERYLIAAAPPFVLLIGAGLATPFQPHNQSELKQTKGAFWRNGSRRVSTALMLLLICGIYLSLINHYANASYSKSVGWRQLAQTMQQLSAGFRPESTRLVQNYPDPTLWYYYDGDVDHLVLPPKPLDEAGTFREVEELISSSDEPVQQVVLALQPADNWDNGQIAQRALSQSFTLVAEIAVKSWPVQVYARPPAIVDSVSSGGFMNGVTLSHAAVAPSEAAAGGVLSIHLGWQQSAILPLDVSGSEKLFLHLLDPENRLIAQHDASLYPSNVGDFSAALMAHGGDATTPAVMASYGILLPSDIPEGNYRLIAGIYDPEQADAPRILTVNEADSVLIKEVMVSKVVGE